MFLALWFAIGVLVTIGLLLIVYEYSGKLSVGDIFFSTLFIFTGPIAIAFVIVMVIINKWLEKIVVRKGDK